MRFTVNWLKRHLDTQATLEEICDTLTAIGLEVEEVQDRTSVFAPFTVAQVTKAVPHPDADRLKVCTVETQNGTVQVVCGAPNARTGMKGIFAPAGAYIPGLDLTLKKTKIRGVASDGMLVSEKEMCLSDEHSGIIEVDESHAVGTPMAPLFGLDDPVIEIALTPNRADCAGVRGIARDLAAAGLGTLKPPGIADIKEDIAPEPPPLKIVLEDREGCPHFTGRVIKNVKNVPSPAWLQNMLKAAGLRPISALVDITNFIAMDQARPLHVYDLDKRKGDITVREARAGETFEALNDHTYETQGGEIGIFDARGLIGLGGIVGGVSTGVDEDTVNVFVESACFDPMRIARAGRRLGITSDARYRFERGIDPEFTRPAQDMAAHLILELCGTEETRVFPVMEDGHAPARAGLSVPADEQHAEPVIMHDISYVEQLTGISVPEDRQLEILNALGFSCEAQKESGLYAVSVPSWRADIDGRADLVEEIVRIVGFDALPATPVRRTERPIRIETTRSNMLTRASRNALVTRGFNECVTWSFMDQKQASLFGAPDNPALRLSNPISEDLSQMRPSILPNLILAARQNSGRGYPDTMLCEIGPVFESADISGQKLVAAGVRAGHSGPRHWADKNADRPVDAYDVKADALAVLSAAGAPAANIRLTREVPAYFHPGRSGALQLGKTVLGYFGALHPHVLEDMNIKTALCGFEIFLDHVPVPRRKSGTAKSFFKPDALQPVHRDFAFIVEETVEADALIRAIKTADRTLIQDVSVFDVYRGPGVEEGHKSMAMAVHIQPADHNTLTEKDLTALSDKIAANVQQKTGGILRGNAA